MNTRPLRRKRNAKDESDELGPGTIGFRLDDESRLVLAQRASQLGVSPHELSRHYVMQVLWEGEDRAALRNVVCALHDEILQLRKDNAFAVEALLASAGKVTEDDARSWVSENFIAH